MATLTVLITTSGTGSRLGTKTLYTNKSLVKLGDKYAICHIIDLYPADTEFIITLGYYGKHVCEFLKLAYPTHNFTFVEIDKFKGAGSSLGYSMLQSKSYLLKPFIFHCCDTIFKNISIVSTIKNENTLFVAKKDEYKQYTSITVKDNLVQTIHKKGYENNDYVYTGVCYIYDYAIFWNMLENEYNKDPHDETLNDISSMKLMCTNGIPFTYNVVTEYFDTGNTKSYEGAMLHHYFKQSVDILEKDDESLCFLDDRVIKFFYNSAMNQKRTIRGNYLYPLTPKILASSEHFMSMERVSGTLLSECQDSEMINKLLNWSYKNLWINPRVNDKYIQCCERFYKTKTLDRILKIPFLENEKTIVNGKQVGTIFDLLNKVDYSGLSTDTFYNFHGDYILDNIFKTEDTYVLIDWRQEFDTELYVGDMYYDLAKLHHNIYVNHKNITNKLYSVNYADNTVSVDIKCNFSLISQLDQFKQFVINHNLDWNRIKILTAIIWINMSPLYEGELREFLFYFGKLNLHCALELARP
jgi:choline kinase